MRFSAILAAATFVPYALATTNMYFLATPDHFDTSACLQSCLREEPACPENMDARKINNKCWTCCLRMNKAQRDSAIQFYK
ncbi:uncharacterized protein BDV14DRAFT_195350 [Aspergillus stella-maris]|uniref:uncharacterized protein n=1 Tax=Aspergillus stella-maris TaxID=1810926 RepID=UPI003CCCC826